MHESVHVHVGVSICMYEGKKGLSKYFPCQSTLLYLRSHR